jgi:hypothetical protein
VTRRYTRAERAEAILICAIGASNPDLNEAYNTIRKYLGLPDLVEVEEWRGNLAIRAWSRCENVGAPHADAEAEALLRDGWTP